MSRKIDAERLAEHIKSGTILEFDSDSSCMFYFNVYDYQNLKSIEDVKSIEKIKEIQGDYGFNIGEKRYHILSDDAMDVYIDDQRDMRFTDDELYILSQGLLSLMGSTKIATQHVYDDISLRALSAAMGKYSELNFKVCGMMK